MVTNDICLFSYGEIKPWERIWLLMIFVYFHMAKLNRGRENLVTNDICLFSYGAIKPWERIWLQMISVLFSYGAIKPQERIWLQMISVYFHMAQLNRGREFGYK